MKAKIKSSGEIREGFLDGKGHFDIPVDHDIFDRYNLEEIEILDSSEIPNDLEEAANSYKETKIANGHFFKIKGTKPLCYLDDLIPAFIAGAKWDREQMLKGAIKADVNTYRDLAAGKSWAEFVVEMPTNNLGDKVRIIIIKEN